MNKPFMRILMGIALIGAASLLITTNAHAQLCKWTDKDGTVHYAETCAEGEEGKDVDVSDSFKSTGGDPYAGAGSKSKGKSSASANSKGGTQSRNYTPADCERARQAKLKPEREQLTKQCIAKGDKDASYCSRFYANHGDGGRQGGHTVARKYDNLPECVAARGGK